MLIRFLSLAILILFVLAIIRLLFYSNSAEETPTEIPTKVESQKPNQEIKDERKIKDIPSPDSGNIAESETPPGFENVSAYLSQTPVYRRLLEIIREYKVNRDPLKFELELEKLLLEDPALADALVSYFEQEQDQTVLFITAKVLSKYQNSTSLSERMKTFLQQGDEVHKQCAMIFFGGTSDTDVIKIITGEYSRGSDAIQQTASVVLGESMHKLPEELKNEIKSIAREKLFDTSSVLVKKFSLDLLSSDKLEEHDVQMIRGALYSTHDDLYKVYLLKTLIDYKRLNYPEYYRENLEADEDFITLKALIQKLKGSDSETPLHWEKGLDINDLEDR